MKRSKLDQHLAGHLAMVAVGNRNMDLPRLLMQEVLRVDDEGHFDTGCSVLLEAVLLEWKKEDVKQAADQLRKKGFPLVTGVALKSARAWYS